MVLDRDLSDSLFLQKFSKSVNALLNSKSGYIIIHAEQIHYLDFIDKKIDPCLRQMLPEKLCYHDVFKRYTHEDGKHIVYFVDHSSQIRPLSIHTPYTKVSLNCGLENANQREVMCLLGRAWPSEELQQQGSGDQEPEVSEEQRAGIRETGHDEEEDMETRETGHDEEEDMETSDAFDRRDLFMLNLAKGKEIKYKESSFAEDFRMQAKEHNKDLRNGCSVDQAFDYLWDKRSLRHYICAFSSVPGGGSVYLGIKEYKSKEQIQTDRGDKQTIQLTKFVCQGVDLNELHKRNLKEHIKRKLSDMVCIGSQKPGNQLEVRFHAVKGADPHPVKGADIHPVKGADIHPGKGAQSEHCEEPQPPDHQQPSTQMYVVEIRVTEYKHGAVFHRGQGPEVYTLEGSPNPKQMESPLDELQVEIPVDKPKVESPLDELQVEIPLDRLIKKMKRPRHAMELERQLQLLLKNINRPRHTIELELQLQQVLKKMIRSRHTMELERELQQLLKKRTGTRHTMESECQLQQLLKNIKRSRHTMESKCRLQHYPFEFQLPQVTASTTR